MPQTPRKPKLTSEKTPTRTIQSNEEFPRSPGSIYRGSTISIKTTTQKDNAVTQATPGVMARINQTELKERESQQSLRSAANTARHTPTISLPRSSRFRQKGIYNFDGAMSLEQEDPKDEGEVFVDSQSQCLLPGLPPTIQGSKTSSHISLSQPLYPAASKACSIGTLGGVLKKDGKSKVPKKTRRSSRPVLKSEAMTRCAGKVSDLRKFFERSSIRGSSPAPSKGFWQNRDRDKPEINVKKRVARNILTASTTTLETQVAPLERILTPELTTQISTDDFSCNFAEALGDAEASKLRVNLDADVDGSHENPTLKQESPVKSRIQQFECLEQNSPVASLVPSARAKSYNANLHTPSKVKGKGVKQSETDATRHPFKQRSAELWRRISNPFTRSADTWGSSSDDDEKANSSTVDDTDARPQPAHRRVRYRRSRLFGYHLYRTSEVIHSSADSSHSELGINTDDELVATFRNEAPSTYQSMRRTFPFLARMSESLGGVEEFNDFGLDGTVLSKATRCRDKPASDEASQGLNDAQSDAKPISKTASQQTTAERKRRRLEEKKLRREQREKKRIDKAKAKGKAKDTGADDGDNSENNEQGKGKGKESDGKKKESSWSKKTSSGFVVRQINDVKLRHPKPRRPGQVRKIVNMYKEKASSGIKLGKGSGVGSTHAAGTSAEEGGN